MVSFTLICIALGTVLPFSTATSIPPSTRYTRAHSLRENYQFDPSEWSTINVTNMQYKYRRDLQDFTSEFNSSLDVREPKTKKLAVKKKVKGVEVTKHTASIGKTINGVLESVWDGLKGLGTAKPVVITWYTGKDLNNPSCWAQNVWTPTDASFACALTLQGWKDKPKCFEFLELCTSAKKCVFVRVVDSCAGCATGSQHVDLTRAAFHALADFDTGILTVNLRPASQPTGWYTDLWGPKV